MRPYENSKIIKSCTGQGDDNKIDCVLDYPYFKDIHRMIAIDVSK